MAAILGIRGSGNFATNVRPYDWNEMILRLYPNGKAPLTALLSKMKKQETTDPLFYWWEQGIATMRIQVNGEVAADGASITVDTDGGENTRAGTVLLVESTGEMIRCSADGTATVVTCTAGRAFGETSAAIIPDDAWLLILGDAIAEGSGVPTAVAYDPSSQFNYTQIFRTSLNISNTAKVSSSRVGDHYENAKYDTLEQHAIKMERQYIFGERKEATTSPGSTGQPIRTTRGIKTWISTNSWSGIGNISRHTWNVYMEQVFRYGSNEKLALCGNTALLAINEMTEGKATINIVPGDTTYGIRIFEYITPFGVLMLKPHPLFNEHAVHRQDMLIVDVPNVIYRPLRTRDTQFLTERQANGTDSKVDEFLTEAGLQVTHESTHAYLAGISGWTGD